LENKTPESALAGPLQLAPTRVYAISLEGLNWGFCSQIGDVQPNFVTFASDNKQRNLSSTASRAAANPLYTQTPHTLCTGCRGGRGRVNGFPSAQRLWRRFDAYWFGEVDLAPLAL